MDDNIGILMDYLKKNGLIENTIVIYTSDQGFYMGEHGWFDKRFIYEESLSTPLIVRIPEKLSDQRGIVEAMVQNIDHAPTFLDIAGTEAPGDIQGESYLPWLKGKTPEKWRKGIYYHYQEFPAEHMVKRHYGIRGERFKLIHFYHDFDKWEFYDLKNDPHEMHNLINIPEYQSRIDSMNLELRKLQILYDDPVRNKFN